MAKAKPKSPESVKQKAANYLQKVQTGIAGFEDISYGGLPKGRSTLISGSSGSGKTIFACQFLVEGVRQFQEPGVFVTFEENINDLTNNVKSFGWDIESYQKKNLWRYVDASIPFENASKIVGDYDLGGLIARIDAAIKEIKAKRIVLDSIGSLFAYFQDPSLIRRELLRVISFLKKKKIVIIMTSERLDEYGMVSRFGVEEYITDNVIILRNVLEMEQRRRTIEILKYRGSIHSSGEQSFVITVSVGITIIPLTRLEMKQRSSEKRISSGNMALDKMCGGGFFKDSIVLISGATGTGKTLLATEFIKGGADNNERCLFLAYEESREQLTRNAIGWGVDFTKMDKLGQLHIEAIYPETASLEEHLLNIQTLIESFKPRRVVLDSLTAIERGSSKKNFREFLISLTSYLKKKEITALFTSTSTTIVGGTSVTDSHISTITDSIILLRYAEVFGDIHRVITVLKMRGSFHTKGIFEFDIDSSGMHINDRPFTSISGILGGVFVPTQGSGKVQDEVQN
jgi:circadian clock protein KaiC